MIRIAAVLLVALICTASARAQEGSLRVAIDLDIPPFVMNNARDGLEVSIIRQALKGYPLDFIQMPFDEINGAIAAGAADVEVSVVEADDGVAYSDFFITFENYAISHTAQDLAIADIADLAGHPVFAWQGAYRELGPAFEAMYGPEGPGREDYTEIADLKEEVERFWQHPKSIAVIDRNIFAYFTESEGRSMQDARLHDLFGPVSRFRVGFRSAAVRDAFNDGLATLCATGEYGRLLERYQVRLRKTVCQN